MQRKGKRIKKGLMENVVLGVVKGRTVWLDLGALGRCIKKGPATTLACCSVRLECFSNVESLFGFAKAKHVCKPRDRSHGMLAHRQTGEKLTQDGSC